MIWEEALILINRNIHIGVELDPTLRYRRLVLDAPPYNCTTFNYNEGFKIKIGRIKHIKVPILMLKNIFDASVQNNRIYNRNVFRYCYPGIGDNSTGNGCYIHTVGKIFQISQVAISLNNRSYSIM